jgi:PAS domain S-box-containing protein
MGFSFYHGESRAKIEAAVQLAVEPGTPYDLELEIISAKGVRKWVRTICEPVMEKGKVVRVCGALQDITEQKRMQSDLDENHALYHSLVDQLPAGIFRKDAAGRYVFVNSTFCELKAMPPEQFLGKTALELGLEDTALADSGASHHAQILQTGARIEVEEKHLRADGQTAFFHVVKTPVFNSEGKIAGSQGVLLDITPSKLVEESLRRSQEQLSAVIQRAQCIVFSGEAEGPADWRDHAQDPVSPFHWKFNVLNVAAAQSIVPLELAPGQSYQQAWSRSRHPEDHIKMNQTSGQAFLTGAPFYRNEFRCTDREGNLHWMQQHVTVRTISDHRWQIFGITTDVTELKILQERYRDQHALLRTLIDLAPDYIFVKDMESRYLVVNEALAKCFGRLPAEMLNRADADFLPPELAARFRAGEQQVLATQSYRTYEDTITFPDGRPRVVVTNMVAFHNPQGELAGIVGIGRDITAQKAASRALRENEARLSTIFHASPVGIVITRFSDSQILEANEAFAKLHGCKVDELIGQKSLELGLWADPAQREQLVHLLKTQGWCKDLEIKFRKKEGAEGNLLISAESIQLAGEKCMLGLVRDITEQKHAEAQLMHLAAIVESSEDAIISKQLDGIITSWNDAAERIFGYTAEEAIGTLLDHLLPPGREQEEKQLFARVGRGEIFQHVKTVRIRKDGKPVDVSATISPLKDRSGKIIGVSKIVRDITELKRGEEQIAREQARFKLIFDTVPIGIAFHTALPDGRFARIINEAHLRICGLTRAQHDEPGIYARITHPDDLALQQRFKKQVSAGNLKQFSMEKRYLHRDGKMVWVNFSYQQEIYPDGSTEELTTVVDITERKAAEHQLMELATIVESSEDAIIGKTLTGIITSWNRGAEDIFGYPASEAIGQSMAMLFPAHRKNEEAEILARISRGGSVEHFETERIRKDGAVIRISATISPLRNSQGIVVGASKIARDITRQHFLEEQLRQSQKMEAIGQLAGGVAHDFNNILAVIQMQTELAKIEGEFSAEQAACLDEIQVAANRAANLTRQLLLFSRRQRLQPRDLDLSDSITGMTKMLRRLLGEDIQMQFKYAPQPLFIHADAGMMDQLLMNLTVNSRDAMPNGGLLIIETAALEFDELAASQSAQARPGSYIRLSVSDTGTGIPPEILPRIFEPFFTTKDVGKGTGLGLATVFSIVQQHQGWIDVYTEAGHGTTFHIYLPRLNQTSAHPTAIPSALTSASGGAETILLVEDDVALRGAMLKALTQLGYRVLEAGSGAEALKVWAERRPEIRLLLTDLVMPGGMNGKELGQRLLRENPKLKILYASGYSAEVAGKDFPLVEGVNFLPKPFPAQMLAQTIRACLNHN